MVHLSVDHRSGPCDRRFSLRCSMVPLGGMDLQHLYGCLWSSGGTRNEEVDRLSGARRVPDPRGLVVWAGEEDGAHGTGMDPVTPLVIAGYLTACSTFMCHRAAGEYGSEVDDATGVLS